MAASLASNRSVARQVTLTAIALVALVLVLVGLAIALLTERSTRAQVVASVGIRRRAWRSRWTRPTTPTASWCS